MKFRHLHPLSLILFYKDELHLFVLFLVSIFSLGNIISKLFLLFIIIWPIVRYFTYHYAILDSELYIRSGLFFKRQNHIPYNRMQTIQKRQWFFLKPYNLEEVIIDTASHSKHRNDVTLRAVHDSVANEIEQKHKTATGKQQDINVNDRDKDSHEENDSSSKDKNEATTPDVVAYQISTRDMNIFALTSTNIVVGFILVSRFLNETHLFSRIINNYVEHFTFSSVIQVIASFLTLILVLMFINFIQIWIRYFNFTLRKQNGYLLITRGLIQRSTIKIPVKRIQAVEFKQSIIRQFFHLVTVQVDVIANQGGNDRSHETTVMPVINHKQLYSKMKMFFPDIPVEEPRLKKASNYSTWLFIRNGFLITLLPFIVVGYFYHGIVLWITLLIVEIFAILNGWYKGKNTKVRLTDADDSGRRQLIMQSVHFFSRKQVLVDWHHIQSMRIRESVWMKNNHLGHLHLSIRNSSKGKNIETRYLDSEQYRPIYDWYLRKDL